MDRRSFLLSGAAFSLAGLWRGPAAAEMPQQLPAINSGFIWEQLAAIEKKGGGEIRLPSGVIELPPVSKGTAGLTLPYGTVLTGTGPESTIIRMGDNAFGHAINAPFGGVTIQNLTVDGNREGRPDQRGHNIRVEGSRIVIQRVRSLNSVGYAIALGERRYAEARLTNVFIQNAGADGVDMKNSLLRTSVTFEGVKVEGHGMGKRDGLDPALWRKAAIDLRGKCTLRDIEIVGVPFGCDGLRFRQDSTIKGDGAHGSTCEMLTVSGISDAGSAVAVHADDVVIKGTVITGTAISLLVRGSNFTISGGRIQRPGKLFASIAPLEQGEARLVADDIVFTAPKSMRRAGKASAEFSNCRFEQCTDMAALADALEGSRLVDCQFDTSCR